MSFLPWVDVRQYGARAGASASTAVQAAHDALPAGGGVLYFQPGATLDLAGVTITKDDVVLVLHAAMLRKNANGAILSVSGARCRMVGGRFDGESGTYTGVGVSWTGADGHLDGVTISDTESVALDVPSGAARIEIIGGSYQSVGGVLAGIRIGNVSEVSSPRIIGATSAGGLTVETIRVDNAIIEGCDGAQFAITTANSKKVRFVGNRIANGSLAVAMTVGGTDHTIIGNAFAQGGITFDATSADCIYTGNRQAGTITNNGTRNIIHADDAAGREILTHGLQFNSAASDANPRLRCSATGIEAGAGGASALDVALSRGAANTWHMGSSTQAARLNVFASAAGDNAYRTFVTTDGQPRWAVLADGTTKYGDGTNAADVTEERSGTGVLKTTGKRWITGELEVDGDLNHDGTNVGFYGVAPVARPSAYTQTYAAADKTIAARTAAALTDNSGGTSGGTTIAAIPNPSDTPISADALRDDLVANTIPAIKNAIATLAAMLNKVLDDDLDGLQGLNALLNDLRSQGLLQ